MGGLLHLVQREKDWAGPQPVQAAPHCIPNVTAPRQRPVYQSPYCCIMVRCSAVVSIKELHRMDRLQYNRWRRSMQWFGHVQRSDDPIDFQQKRWQHCNGHKRLQKKENETWIDCVSDTEDLRRRGSSECQAAECVKRRKQRRKLVNECVPSSAKYGPRSTSYGKQETVSTMRCQFSLRVAFLSRVSMLMRDINIRHVPVFYLNV